jgi:cell division protein FtsW
MSFVQEKLNFLRINKNQHVSWWAGVDKISFACICLIVAFSLVMVTTASPAVASRIGVEPFYFIKRQIVFTISGFTLLLIFSNQDLEFCRRIGVIGFFLFLFLLILVLFFGPEVKGARRWINIAGFSLQPSEFIKPFFAVFIAWVMSIKYVEFKFPAFTISIIFYMITVALLMLQPDFGMTMTLTVIYASQLFIAGLSILWIIIFISLIVLGLFGGYLLFPHIKKRIDSFLTPENFENYQVKKSLEAFQHGKLYGVGPGEGTVKLHIPDSHTDFIFSVLGEEMGVIACALLIILFGP